MLSVIIPTEGVEQPAVATLAALVPGAAAGVIREVLLVDRAGNGVIERSNPMSGESLRVMTLREVSSDTVVLKGGRSSRLCQPSSKATRASASNRPLALDCAPRPRRRLLSIATASSGKGVAPAGSEGAVTGGCLRA